MNAIRNDFEALGNQILAEKDHKFCLIFDLSLNLLHKSRILKNSKKALHTLARPIAIKRKWTFRYKLWYKIGQNPRFPEVFEKWIFQKSGFFHFTLHLSEKSMHLQLEQLSFKQMHHIVQ